MFIRIPLSNAEKLVFPEAYEGKFDLDVLEPILFTVKRYFSSKNIIYDN